MEGKYFACLLLSFVVFSIVNGDRVKQLPQIGDLNVVTESGFLTINQSANSNIFYLFYEAQNNPQTAPLALWLQGGPGVSSMMAAFSENGPYNISPNGTLSVNEYSWNTYSNILYIDQPLGTGYSYTDDPNAFPTNEEEVSSDIYAALQLFYQMYPQYSSNPFFITTESYGGKFAPSLATYIDAKNKKLQSGEIYIPLTGVSIGNGWVHPTVQNQAYVDYPYTLGLISAYERDQAQLINDKLELAIEQGRWDDANNLSNELEAFVVSAAGNIDEDNILFPVDPFNAIGEAMDTYLNSEEVRSALNVGNHSWCFENGTSYNALNADEQRSVLGLLPHLINNYRVLIYTGNVDLNCNVLGVDNYLNLLPWADFSKWYTAPRVMWNVDGNLAGYAKNLDNFTNLVVRNSGHEVPFFQPKNALDLFKRFIQNIPYGK